jgi:hypothetical protein
MFSIFESLLQDCMQWTEPFDSLNVYLRKHQRDTLAQTVGDYKLAINVLKHGRGASYEGLLARGAELEFNVKPKGDYFFFEGDVSEVVGVLVDVDDRFVRRCAALIEEASALIRSEEQLGELI